MACKWFWVCPMKRYYEQGRIEQKWIDEYCKGNNKRCRRYIMEERGEYHPDYMLPNGTLDESLKSF